MLDILAEQNAVDPRGYSLTLEQFEKIPQFDKLPPRSILEIGPGSGHFSIMLGERFPDAQILGIDTNALSVEVARGNLIYAKFMGEGDGYLNNVNFKKTSVRLEEGANTADIITTTSINHHISSFTDFLRRVKSTGKRAFIFNDLVRSPGCYAKAYLFLEIIRRVGIEPFVHFSRFLPSFVLSPTSLKAIDDYGLIFAATRPGLDLVIDGGILSVARSFTMDELKTAFRDAGYKEGALHCDVQSWMEQWLVLGLCRMGCYASLTD